MVKKYENKAKAKKRPAKSTVRARNKDKNGKTKTSRTSSNFSSTTSEVELDYTLPDNNHLDSFDIFVDAEKRELRHKGVLKKEVRASFNLHSSLESLCDEKKKSMSPVPSSYKASEASGRKLPKTEEDVENIDPNEERNSLRYGCAINSSNSWMFSDSRRAMRKAKKAKMNENDILGQRGSLTPGTRANSTKKRGRSKKLAKMDSLNTSSELDISMPSKRRSLKAIGLAQFTSTPQRFSKHIVFLNESRIRRLSSVEDENPKAHQRTIDEECASFIQNVSNFMETKSQGTKTRSQMRKLEDKFKKIATGDELDTSIIDLVVEESEHSSIRESFEESKSVFRVSIQSNGYRPLQRSKNRRDSLYVTNGKQRSHSSTSKAHSNQPSERIESDNESMINDALSGENNFNTPSRRVSISSTKPKANNSQHYSENESYIDVETVEDLTESSLDGPQPMSLNNFVDKDTVNQIVDINKSSSHEACGQQRSEKIKSVKESTFIDVLSIEANNSRQENESYVDVETVEDLIESSLDGTQPISLNNSVNDDNVDQDAENESYIDVETVEDLTESNLDGTQPISPNNSVNDGNVDQDAENESYIDVETVEDLTESSLDGTKPISPNNSVNDDNVDQDADNESLIASYTENADSRHNLEENQSIDVSVLDEEQPSFSKETSQPNTSEKDLRKSKKSKFKVGFNVADSIHEVSLASTKLPSHDIVIKGGKWRRTVYELRKSKITQSPQRRTLEQQRMSIRRKSINVKNIPDRRTLHEVTNRVSSSSSGRQSTKKVVVLDESDVESFCSSESSPKTTPINALSKQRSSRLLRPIDCVDFVQYRQSAYARTHNNSLNSCSSASVESVVDEIADLTSSLHLDYNQHNLKAQLLKRCGQDEVFAFDEVYSASTLKNCRKIGEGVFGEVFLNETKARSSFVLKIIPIEGIAEINGAQQKRFDEILQEVIISQELSALRNDKENSTTGFVEVLNVRLVEGRYPAHLLDLWQEYKDRRGTENDDPDVFTDDQLYVVFELANCGLDLEAHVFKNAEQSFSAYKQVAASLAVAEAKHQFEHRDLHWGNVLVVPTAEKTLSFILNGKPIEIRTHGVKATIIDYTLSRIIYKDCCLYQDLAADPELFEATGDYQYDIYRLMRKVIPNDCWETYEPFTNILWLHYMIDKLIDGVRYSSKKTNKHRQAIDNMMKLRDQVLEYKSSTELYENFLLDNF